MKKKCIDNGYKSFSLRVFSCVLCFFFFYSKKKEKMKRKQKKRGRSSREEMLDDVAGIIEYSTPQDLARLEQYLAADPSIAVTEINAAAPTPIGLAAFLDNKAALELLLRHYPEAARFRDESGLYPLHYAAEA
ncbi:MAG TPA: hypothetical protein VJH89_01270, partial [Patescibacteria group bacterium]|nr:hypothetical protein [Patescibacteria group bacterium]